MITVFLIFYAFMGGMTAEYVHTKGKSMVLSDKLILASLIAAFIWPWYVWGSKR
ncbi:hypothetical protein C7387_2305 [Yokenella regensburgei]|uniref:Uncharacterized protein n=1 Tax=Yokenella regensburgei TaxID=158877 RepID=A0ABX9S418_9ENTR|nr:hypothetical protein C7387_2305 [Yokenella regensburgei]VFS16067.1 Uncharacterised protein [Yokenella regensburgei]